MNQTSKSKLTALNLIYFSLIIVLTLFGAIVFITNASGGINVDTELALLLRYVLCVVLPLGLGAGYYIFKQFIKSINASFSLQEKMFKYQTAVLIRSACFEMPGLLGAVSAFITGDNSFLLFTAIIIVLFLILRPSAYTITNDLKLTQSERAQLENPSTTL